MNSGILLKVYYHLYMFKVLKYLVTAWYFDQSNYIVPTFKLNVLVFLNQVLPTVFKSFKNKIVYIGNEYVICSCNDKSIQIIMKNKVHEEKVHTYIPKFLN